MLADTLGVVGRAEVDQPVMRTAAMSLPGLVDEARAALEARSVELVLFEVGRSWVVAAAGADPTTGRLGRTRSRLAVEEEARRAAVPTGDGPGRGCIPLVRADGVVIGGLLVDGARRPLTNAAQDHLAAELVGLLEGEEAPGGTLAAIHHGGRDIVLVVDGRGTLTHVSGAVTRQLGHRRRDLVGTDGIDLVHPDDVDAALRALGELATDGEARRVTVRIRHVSGFWIPFSITGANRLGDPAVAGIVLHLRNESFEDALNEQLYQARHLTAALAHHLEDGIVLCDRQGRLTLVNDTARRLHTAQGLPVPSHVDELAVGRHADGPSPLWRSLHDGEVTSADTEVRTGGVQHVLQVRCRPVDDDHGRRIGALMVIRDVTHDRREAEQLRLQAHRDELTGLPNRTVARAVLRGRWARAGEGHRAVLFADVDGLKSVNDRFGHHMGDELLVEIARRLANATRGGDLVSRWGGDEFLIVCGPLHHPREAEEIAERIRHEMGKPLVVGDVVLEPSVSLGLTVVDEGDHSVDYDTAVALADRGMYRAKRERRRTVGR
jgi:diguanylate cyclase (GGDEF)-like protein/PAS domain S-box-containing protein